MKNLFVLFVVLSFCAITRAQYIVDNFDSSAVKAKYQISVEGATSRIDVTDNHTDFKEGTGSFEAKYVIGSYHTWGSYGNLTYRVPNNGVMDWSKFDSLSIWIKVKTAPKHPEWMAFRIHLADQPDSTGNVEEFIYENTTVIDSSKNWYELKIPLYERYSDGTVNPNDSGFVRMPTSWNPPAGNNWKLDWDKIRGFNITAVTTGSSTTNLPADSVTIDYDNFKLFGAKVTPFVFFNGKVIPPNESIFTWGQSSFGLEEGIGPVEGLNSIKWIQGNEWNNGWTGAGFNIAPSLDMSAVWQRDSVKFKMKAEAGVGAMRIQFESNGAKTGFVFTPNADNAWHQYVFPLKNCVPQDGTTGFDSSKVTVFQIMAEATGIAGKIIYLSEMWTGTPVLDVIAPKAPTGVSAVTSKYSNMVTWIDVSGEVNEVYDVYFSSKPITDITSADVELLKKSIPHGVQYAEHPLKAPGTDQNVTYYYAVRCVDASGNAGKATASSAITNLAKGIVTITYKDAGFSTFKADGVLTDWAGVKTIRLATSDGSGFKVSNTTITDDADCSATVYVAMDKDNLYVAFDVADDIFSPLAQSSTWLNDCPDLFIGLYDGHGVLHSAYRRGTQPDYHFRFAKDRVLLDGLAGGDSLMVPGANYYFEEAKFPKAGWTVEAKVPFALLVTKSANADQLFVPKEGMKIPFDIEISDADATGTREGQLDYSSIADGNSYADVSRWGYTWINDKWVVGVNDKEQPVMVNTYSLSQNYPNPFNPSTVINYSIAKPGHVSVKVFDVLGREVATLVNGTQTSGQHTVRFDAAKYTSGVYIYKIESGDFQSAKKMLLIK